MASSQQHSDDGSQLHLMTVTDTPVKRMLPLDLGRVELVSWWLKSCCKRRDCPRKKSLCTSCRSLVANAKFLSKKMFRLSVSGTLRVTGKNVSCMYINDEPVSRKSIICMYVGDEITFRSKTNSEPWMRFELCSNAQLVTPEKAQSKMQRSEETRLKFGSKQQERNGSRYIHHQLTPLPMKRKRLLDETTPNAKRAPVAPAASSSQAAKHESSTEENDSFPHGNRGNGDWESRASSVLSLEEVHTKRALFSHTPKPTRSSKTDQKGSSANTLMDTPLHENKGKKDVVESQASSVLSLPSVPSYCDPSDQSIPRTQQHVNISAPIQCSKNQPNANIGAPIQGDDTTKTDTTVSDMTLYQWRKFGRNSKVGSVRHTLAQLVIAQRENNCTEERRVPIIVQGAIISTNGDSSTRG